MRDTPQTTGQTTGLGPAPTGRRAWKVALCALGAYGATLAVVVLGITAGARWLAPAWRPASPRHVPPAGNAVVEALSLWDAQWYLEIASQGYSYHPRRQSAVAFFPAYPVLVRAVRDVTGLPLQAAGLVVSHGFLLGALVVLWRYGRQRFSKAPARAAGFAVASLAVFPTGLFFRMAYTESLFVFLCLLVFWGMERRWPPGVLAGIVGLATATRSVGVALVVPLAMHVWEQTRSWRQAATRLAGVLPLSAWGILGYMGFQAAAFGEPLAFVKTQQFWRMRPPLPVGEMVLVLGSWEPIWSVYLPGMPGYWREVDRGLPLVLSYQSFNCVAFVAAAALLAAGGVKGWLSGRELALGVCLLAIPYVSAGYRFCMASQGRYVSVVFPVYLVLGQWLSRMPRLAAAGVLAVLAAYLGWFSAMLAAGYFMV